MANTDLQGSALPLLLSDDNWTTAYTVTCLKGADFKISYPVNVEESQCGVHTGTGSVAFSLNFNGLVNTTPAAVSAGAGEASWKMIQGWANNKTLLRFKLSSGASGVNFYDEGQAYLNDLTMSWEQGKVIGFNGTLTGTGTLDQTF